MWRDCVPPHTGGSFEFIVAVEWAVTSSVLSTPPPQVTAIQPPRFLDQMRQVLWVRHYSPRRRRDPCTGSWRRGDASFQSSFFSLCLSEFSRGSVVEERHV